MEGGGRQGMHAWLGNVLGVDGHIPLPHADALVIRGGDNPRAIFDEGYGVDSTQVP